MSSANHSLETCKTHAKWDRTPAPNDSSETKAWKEVIPGRSKLNFHSTERSGVSPSTYTWLLFHCRPTWTSSTTVTRWSHLSHAGSLPWESLWLLWLPTVEVSRVYQKQLMWKGKTNSKPPRFSWTELINWNAKNNSYKDRKETRASMSQTSSEKLCSLFKGLHWAAPHYSSHLIPKDSLPE